MVLALIAMKTVLLQVPGKEENDYVAVSSQPPEKYLESIMGRL